MGSFIDVKSLSFRYENEPVLDNVSFCIREGDFVALTGVNGAGKSTLLRLLLGELSSPQGIIRLWSVDVRAFKDWHHIGYVPQNGGAAVQGFPATAMELVLMGMYAQIGPLLPARKRHRQKALEALGRVGMAPYANKMVSRMSGGQVQRVMIARALAADTRALLLDEPVSGLDAAAAGALYGLLAALNQEGMTVVMVTHDMKRARHFAGRAFCLEDGALVEQDTLGTGEGGGTHGDLPV